MAPNVLSVLVGAAARTGGPPVFVGGSARELARLGGHMTVLATDLALAPTGWLQRQRRVQADELQSTLAETDVRLFPARFPRRLAFSPALAKAVRREVPGHDVVHLHNLWQHPQYAGFRAAREAGVPYIVSPHGGLDPYLRLHGRARKRLTTTLWQERMLNEAALIHVTTDAEQELIADIAPDVPRAVVPPGIYVADFDNLPPRLQFRERYLDGFEGPIVLFLGRITYKKGLQLLISSFSHLRASCDARLVIVGPDDEGLASSLRKLAHELRIDGDVLFPGPLYGEDRLAALSAADVWALSSHTENFGIAVIEAMAAGCPVVISPAVNLARDISAADAGIVAELDERKFAAGLLEPLADVNRHRSLVAAGRTFAERYDWRVVGPQLLEMYRSAAAH